MQSTITVTFTCLQYHTIKQELTATALRMAKLTENSPFAEGKLNAEVRLAKLNNVLDYLATLPINE
jgi:hypothetical protein